MPDSLDRFGACIQFCRRIVRMTNDMRENTTFFKRCYDGLVPGSPLAGDLPKTQQALRDLARAFNADGGSTGLMRMEETITKYGPEFRQSLQALGVAPTDFNARLTRLRQWTDALAGATFADAAALTTFVNSLLADVAKADMDSD